MTPDNPYMPQAIRDAIIPGAAAELWSGDPDGPDGVIVTRDNYDLGVNGEDTMRETLRGVLARTAPSTITWLRSFVCLRRDQERDPHDQQPPRGPLARGLRRRHRPQRTRRSAVPRSIRTRIRRSPAACRTTSSATTCAIRPRPTGSTRTASPTPRSRSRLSPVRCPAISASSQLPGGAIGFAVGAEYRKETATRCPRRKSRMA